MHKIFVMTVAVLVAVSAMLGYGFATPVPDTGQTQCSECWSSTALAGYGYNAWQKEFGLENGSVRQISSGPSGSSDNRSPSDGYYLTSALWAKAVLKTSDNDIDLVWKKVGADITPIGAQVVSGYFYADPADFAYGSVYNPEVFVKIFIATDGWCNIAFNHVTVDSVDVYSAHHYEASADQSSTIKTTNRLAEHQYQGVLLGSGETLTNSLGMTFNLIAAGTFTMGSPFDELGHEPGNEDQHPVTLTHAYYMQTTEITQGQWRALMGSNPSGFLQCGDDCPVESVSWDDCQAFVAEMNKRGEGTYRLPTEAEWEYAARAGSAGAFANGDISMTGCGEDPNLTAMGWYCGNSDSKTHPVAVKRPNAWGLYDMHGNVWEWCQDWHASYPSVAVTDPEGPATGERRVVRGGSWYTDAERCRSALRGLKRPNERDIFGGVRLVLTKVQ